MKNLQNTRATALHELLENTLVVQVLNNRAERRMKVSLLFETYPDKSVRQQLQQAIQEAYSLQESTRYGLLPDG